MKEIQVDAAKFHEMTEKYSGYELTQGRVKGTVMVDGKEYVVTGVTYFGKQPGADTVKACEVIDKYYYREGPEPKFHDDHWRRTKQHDYRSYLGLMAKCGKRVLVLLSANILARPSGSGEQLSIL